MPYLKLLSDEYNKPGYFIVTGSSNFLMNQYITESLAGRVGIMTMLPFSLQEIQNIPHNFDHVDNYILQGSYLRVYTQSIEPDVFYPSYIHSYVERDVRYLSTVGDLFSFQKFMKLCARQNRTAIECF